MQEFSIRSVAAIAVASVAVFFVIFISTLMVNAETTVVGSENATTDYKACPAIAKVCADGTSRAPEGSSCTFGACPGESSIDKIVGESKYLGDIYGMLRASCGATRDPAGGPASEGYMTSDTQMRASCLLRHDQIQLDHENLVEALRAKIATMRKASTEDKEAVKAQVGELRQAHEQRREARFDGACERYGSTDAVPTGWGSAYNIAGGAGQLLRIRCDQLSEDIAVDVGDGEPTTYVYEKAYVYQNNAWKQVQLDSDKEKVGVWYVGDAFADVSETAKTGNNGYIAAYTCSYQEANATQEARWNCGCHDKACATNHWQLQAADR